MTNKQYRPIKGCGFECHMCEQVTWEHTDNPGVAAIYFEESGGVILATGQAVCYDCTVNVLGMRP